MDFLFSGFLSCLGKEEGGGHSIHNIFFRRAAELGIPFLFIMCYQLYYLRKCFTRISFILKHWGNNKILKKYYFRNELIYIYSSVIIVVSALFIAFFVPSYIWGGVGQSWLFWTMMTIIVILSKKIYINFKYYNEIH